MELGCLRLAIALYLSGTAAALLGIAPRQDLPRPLLPRLLWVGFLGHGLSITLRSWPIGHLAVTPLHQAPSSLGALRYLPSLETLDRVNYRCLVWGLVLLTLGIVSGIVWAHSAWGRFWS